MSRTTTQFARNRRGFSLIEMTVVIAVSSVLLGIVVSYIIALKQWDRNARSKSLRGMQMLALAESLRTDIRGGSDVLLSVEGPLVIMAGTGVQMRYEFRDEGCVRTVVTADVKTPDSEAGRRDLFAVGGGGRWKVERKETGRRPLIEVTVEPSASENQSKESWSPPLCVYAALGADPPAAIEPLSNSVE